MEPQFVIDWVSRLTHVSTAIALVGGSLFSVTVLMPAAQKALGEKEEHRLLAASVLAKWKRWVHLGIVLFLVSGFYNYFRAMPLHKGDGLYHALVGTKMLLAFAVFFLASVLVGRSAKFEGMRAERRKWTAVMVCLALVVVALSSFVKVRGVPAASDGSAPRVSDSE